MPMEPIKGKILNTELLQRYLEDKEDSLTFEKCNGAGLTFSEAIINKRLVFNEITFALPVSFTNCTFNKELLFRKCKFLDKADFTNSVFTQKVWFSGSHFNGNEAVFTDTTFQQDASFNRITTEPNNQFQFNSLKYYIYQQIEPSGIYRLPEPRNYPNTIYFNNATFSGVVAFNGRIFNSTVYFQNVKFLNYFYFTDTDMGKKFIISNVKYCEDDDGNITVRDKLLLKKNLEGLLDALNNEPLFNENEQQQIKYLIDQIDGKRTVKSNPLYDQNFVGWVEVHYVAEFLEEKLDTLSHWRVQKKNLFNIKIIQPTINKEGKSTKTAKNKIYYDSEEVRHYKEKIDPNYHYTPKKDTSFIE